MRQHGLGPEATRRAARVKSMAIRTLMARQQRFAEALATDPDQNQTAAAKVAGYRDPSRMGSLMARN